jgi:hypothetical protein
VSISYFYVCFICILFSDVDIRVGTKKLLCSLYTECLLTLISFSFSPSEEASSSRQLQRQPSNEEVLNPGQAGFISRARVPKPSTKAYINRPKSTIEGQFHGPSKARSITRFDIAQREFKMRTLTKKAKRHVGPSISKLE